MPGAPETAWGVWGEPGPIKPWEHGAPKLHGETGGSVQPEFSETLKWFYRRANNPKDKEHCLRLLAQIQLKREDSKKEKQTLAIHGHSVKPPLTPKRPSSAKVLGGKAVVQRFRERPKTAVPGKKTLVGFTESAISQKEEKGNSTYQRQKESIDRLSRPKTAGPAPQSKFVASRPKSAMAAVGKRKYNDPYLTTHESDFPGYSSGLYSEAVRPMSSKGFTAPYELSGPIGETTFVEKFGWKEATRIEPIRSGTSSGNRRNNPHPQETFMVWKLPTKSIKGMVTTAAPHLEYRELSQDVLHQILRDQHKSTYQSDYLGIPQGYQVKTAIDAPVDWRPKIRRPLDTTVRYSYLRPQQLNELVGNTTRYGCNKNKGIPALGTVPTVTSSHVKNQEVIKGKTTYDVEYRNRHGQPDLEKLLNNQPNKRALERYLRYARTDLTTTNFEKTHRDYQLAKGTRIAS